MMTEIPRSLGMILFLACLFGLTSLVYSAEASDPKANKSRRTNARGPWPYLQDVDQQTTLAELLTAKNYVLIFDGSGSMNERECADKSTKSKVAKAAAMEWTGSVPSDANIGLVAFHSGGWLTRPLGARNREEFHRLLRGIIPGGKTPLGAAVKKALGMLTRRGKAQLGYGEYTIVVVTDGKASDPNELKLAIKRVLNHTPIVVYTIGFCIGTKHSLNQPRRTIYKTANNPAELRTGLKEVLAESEVFDVADFKK